MIHAIIMLAVFFFLYKLQGYVYRKNWDEKLSVDLRYAGRAAFEGQKIGFSEHVYNGKLLPMPYFSASYSQSVRLRQQDLGGRDMYYGRARISLFVVPGKRHITRKTMLVCEKRGAYSIDKVLIQSSDLFFSRPFAKEVKINASITVYPKEIEVSEAEVPYNRLVGDILTKRFILPDPFEFTGIREYQPFDSFRQINFNAWARTGEPMSNVYGYTVSQELCIVLNMQHYSRFRRDGVFENAIRLAAFLARVYLESGIPVSFVTNGLDCVTGKEGRAEKGQALGHLHEVYEILARIDLKESYRCRNIRDFLPGTAALGAWDMAVALVSAFADEELYDWHDRTVSSGNSVLWIAPICENDKIDYRSAVIPWVTSNE